MILSVSSSALGSTVFALAEEFQERQLELIEKAKDLGSDGDAEDLEEVRERRERFRNQTALLAAARSKPTAVALLLQAGADVHEGTFGGQFTPLHGASSADCASVLLEARAEPDRFDGKGMTPLHLAVCEGWHGARVAK